MSEIIEPEKVYDYLGKVYIYNLLTEPYMIDNQSKKRSFRNLVDTKIRDGEIERTEEINNYLNELDNVDITIQNVSFPMLPFPS